MKQNYFQIVLYGCILVITVKLLVGCSASPSEPMSSDSMVKYQIEDLEGQWTLIDVDTVTKRQSLSQNEIYEKTVVEYDRPIIEVVEGVLKCTHWCTAFWPKEIEFKGDSIFEYQLPIRLNNRQSIASLVDNQLTLNGFQYIWYESVSAQEIKMSDIKDTLYVSYLEETGLFLREVYLKSHFEDTVIDLLKKYGENLPEASGVYQLVHYRYESVDYDSPFEHYHSFPYEIPETLKLSKQDLLEVLKHQHQLMLPTDGALKAYSLSCAWNVDLLWLEPEDWYSGLDTSRLILYEKVESN